MNAVRLAIFGGSPAFERALPIGQLYFPDWSAYEAAMRGIFERQYYTNQGPLAQQLEHALQEQLGVRHAICVTNATIGLLMAADALGLRGKIITPSFSFIATTQSLSWCGLEPLFCDIDPLTHQLDPAQVEVLLQDENVSAVLAVNLWGDFCDHERLREMTERYGVPLYYDSAHAFGCMLGEKAVGSIGTIEVFSFHATKVLSAAEGGCICTDDDELAARLRNIRSSYGAGRSVHVSRTANGRMSEVQAAIALLSLEKFPQIIERNRRIYSAYEASLTGLPGFRLLKPKSVSATNYQYVVCEIDAEAFGISRDELQAVLRAENVLARRYFYPGIHRCQPYDDLYPDAGLRLPVTESLCEKVLQLPIGELVDDDMARKIASLIRCAHQQAREVRTIIRASL